MGVKEFEIEHLVSDSAVPMRKYDNPTIAARNLIYNVPLFTQQGSKLPCWSKPSEIYD